MLGQEEPGRPGVGPECGEPATVPRPRWGHLAPQVRPEGGIRTAELCLAQGRSGAPILIPQGQHQARRYFLMYETTRCALARMVGTVCVMLLTGINILALALPFAWASHWNVDDWGHDTTFVCECPSHHDSRDPELVLKKLTHIDPSVCFIAMVYLQKLLDWGGEELRDFVRKDLRDLFIITLSKYVLCLSKLRETIFISFVQLGGSHPCNHIATEMRVRVPFSSSRHTAYVPKS